MKKSLIAAAFAAALPMGAMAQEQEAPQQTQGPTGMACQPISPTQEFCYAVRNGQVPLIGVETPEGTTPGIPGIKIDNEGNINQCIAIIDQAFNIRGLLCQGNVQAPQVPDSLPAEPDFSL